MSAGDSSPVSGSVLNFATNSALVTGVETALAVAVAAGMPRPR